MFQYLGINNICRILAAVLTEQRIIFTSDSQSLLSLICDSFLAFIFPFRWCHAYIPSLPAELIDVCDAPVPFIVGVHSLLRPLLSQTALRSCLLVDIENNSVTAGDEHSTVFLCAKEAFTLIHSLKSIIKEKKQSRRESIRGKQMTNADFNFKVRLLVYRCTRIIVIFMRSLGTSVVGKGQIQGRTITDTPFGAFFFFWQVRMAFFEVFPSLLYQYSKCVLVMGDNIPIFNAQVLQPSFVPLVARYCRSHINCASLRAGHGVVLSFVRMR